MIDSYVYVIVALLPLASLMLVFQANPYSALVIRGILGAVAALVYAVLGAADVALTEALVGTMLAITLYVVAVRSSLVMRLGIIEEVDKEENSYFAEVIFNIRKTVNKHHLRLELVEYDDSEALEEALNSREVHAIYNPEQEADSIAIRVNRLFNIFQEELNLPTTILKYVNLSDGNRELGK